MTKSLNLRRLIGLRMRSGMEPERAPGGGSAMSRIRTTPHEGPETGMSINPFGVRLGPGIMPLDVLAVALLALVVAAGPYIGFAGWVVAVGPYIIYGG